MLLRWTRNKLLAHVGGVTERPLLALSRHSLAVNIHGSVLPSFIRIDPNYNGPEITTID